MRGLKRWLKRLLLAAVLLGVGLALHQIVDRYLIRRAGEEKLDAVRAELAAADPGWQLDALLAAREARFPPPDRNPIRLVRQVRALRPASFDHWQMDNRDWLPDVPNCQPVPFHADAVVCLRDDARPATDALQRLKGLPPGGYPLVVPPDVIGVNLEPTQHVREAAALLQMDAVAAALAGDPDRAVSSAHACLAAGRGIGDEPTIISMLVRVAVTTVAAHTAERVLGLSHPRAGLPDLQAAFSAEADAPVLADALRGERAMIDRLFDNIQSGALDADGPSAWRDPAGAYRDWKYEAWRPADRAEYLRVMTAYLDVARRPAHLRPPLFAAVPVPADGDRRFLFTSMLLPSVDRVLAADARSTAVLRTAAAGVACERYRLKTGRWPTDWAELREFLPAVPLDPFDGRPLRLNRRPDGLTVYAVGADGTDDGVAELSVRGEPGTDLGFRLFDPAHRDRPAPEDDP